MNIRKANIEDIEAIANKFVLYHEDNEGDVITVVEDEGEIVAFMQSTADRIYFIESCVNGKGYAKALIDDLKSELYEIVADNVHPNIAPFWEHMGFEPHPYQKGCYIWYDEE